MNQNWLMNKMEREPKNQYLYQEIFDTLKPINDEYLKKRGFIVEREFMWVSRLWDLPVFVDLSISNKFKQIALSITRNSSFLDINLHEGYDLLTEEQRFLAKALAAKQLISSQKNARFITHNNLAMLSIEEASNFFKNTLLPNPRFVSDLKSLTRLILTQESLNLLDVAKRTHLN